MHDVIYIGIQDSSRNPISVFYLQILPFIEVLVKFKILSNCPTKPGMRINRLSTFTHLLQQRRTINCAWEQ